MKMSEKKAMKKLTERLEAAVSQLQASVIMQNLQVMQLDGSITIEKETIKWYLATFDGSKKSLLAFVKHVDTTYGTD